MFLCTSIYKIICIIINLFKFFFIVKIYTCYSSSRIRDFDVQARNCLFEDERDEPNSQVTMFKHYSEENCLLECRAKHLMDKCGCLPYYYPRLDILLDFDQVLHEIKHWFGISVSSVWPTTLHETQT